VSRIRKRDVWFFAGEYERIVQELRPATTVAKSRKQSYYGAEAFEYAYALCAAGSWQAAIEWCEQIISRSNRPSTHEYLCAGLGHLGLGNLAEARQFFMDAAKKRLYTSNAGYEGWFALHLGIVCFGMKAID
jgi:tetratricopeptide (TPR) repeat protein